MSATAITFNGEPKILVVGATGRQGRCFIDAICGTNTSREGEGEGEGEEEDETLSSSGAGAAAAPTITTASKKSASASATAASSSASSSRARRPPLPPPPAQAFRILALTRDPTRAQAQAIVKNRPNVELVRGDLDDWQSMRQVFVNAGGMRGIWGVFVVLAYAKLGGSTEGEAVQGIMLANLAVEFGVSVFVYSSHDHGSYEYGSVHHESLTSETAKFKIEEYVQSLGGQGLQWTILRPSWFMDNYQGTKGRILMSVLQAGLGKDVKLRLSCAEDLGRVAAAIFQHPVNVAFRIMLIVGDELSLAEHEEVYLRVTGKKFPTFPRFVGRLLITLNATVRDVLHDLTYMSSHREEEGELYEEHITNTQVVCEELTTFEQWLARERHKRISKEEVKILHNHVSIFRLLTGRH